MNVEKFGLQHARSALVSAVEWKPLLFSLINAYRRNASLVSLLVEACLLRQVARRDVQVAILTEFIENRILCWRAPTALGRSSGFSSWRSVSG
jgi:hypothetical protein